MLVVLWYINGSFLLRETAWITGCFRRGWDRRNTAEEAKDDKCEAVGTVTRGIRRYVPSQKVKKGE